MHPYLAIVLETLVMVIGPSAVFVAVFETPPRDPARRDLRWIVAIIAALATASALAAILLSVDL